jgi:hypothetical protein
MRRAARVGLILFRPPEGTPSRRDLWSGLRGFKTKY